MQDKNRLAMIKSALMLFPPVVRSSLINEESFVQYAGILTTERIALNQAGVEFKREIFFSTVRDALVFPDFPPVIEDESGASWHVSIEEEDGQRYTLLKSHERCIRLPDFWALSPDLEVRLREFDKEAGEVNFFDELAQKWRGLLANASLDDESYHLLNVELESTPVRVAEKIFNSICSGSSSVDVLVPNNLHYFELLVGGAEDGDVLSSYADGAAKQHIQQLTSWDSVKGLRQALLLSSHSFIIANVDLLSLPSEQVEATFSWVVEHGDLTSKLGAIELGLRYLNKLPQLESYIELMVKDIISDDPNDDSGRFALLSALIMMVGGEVARAKILYNSPPFWSRLATIAHASFIERAVISSGMLSSDFASWCTQARGYIFYWQVLLDLRVEPRWHPDFVSPSQIKAEFLGRISNSATANQDGIRTDTLRQLLLGEGNGGLRELLEFPFSYFPGPLEGGYEPEMDMPPEMLSNLEKELELESIRLNSFAGLVNSALVFRIGAAHAQLAANALQKVKYQLRQSEDSSHIFSLIDGLAKVAAVTRSKELGDEVRVLSRVTRRRKGGGISVDNEVRIAMIAAASRGGLDGWAEFLGGWLTEIAFEVQSSEEGTILLSHLRQIIKLEPALIITCSKAEAALLSVTNY